MRQVIWIITYLVLTACVESKTEQKTATVTDTISKANSRDVMSSSKEDEHAKEIYRKQSLSGFEKATLYKLTDTITADFNGDGSFDHAFYKKENQTSGIIIKHGGTNEEVKIGFGKSFGSMTDFNWVDYWGLVEDNETTETTFTEEGDILGSQKIELKNPSIVVGKDEVGGGLITFRNGGYEWIHQTC